MTKHNAHTGEGEGPAEEKTGLGEEAVPGPETPASEASAGENPAGEAPGNGNTAEERAARDGAAAELPPEDRIAALEAQTADLKDQYLRKAADFENFRKRMIREKQDAIDFANQSLLLDLIPIIDDFERALKSGEALAGGGNAAEAPADTAESAAPAGPEDKAGGAPPEFAGFYEGIGMIAKRLSSQLENKWGLKRFDSAGEPFDPNRHEAIMMEKSPEIADPVVQEDFLKGYLLKDRVIRSAKVKVLMPE